MEDLSLHILDIAENSITAGASSIEISITENIKANIMLLEIKDNGKGMDQEMIKHAEDPFYTTKEKTYKYGLGIPLLAQAARECMGSIKILSLKGKGSTISASFQYNHIDRKPLGDIAATMTVLITSNPEVEFVFTHKKNGKTYMLNNTKIMEKTGDMAMTSARVIKFIKDDINAWLNHQDNMIE